MCAHLNSALEHKMQATLIYIRNFNKTLRPRQSLTASIFIIYFIQSGPFAMVVQIYSKTLAVAREFIRKMFTFIIYYY